MEKRIKDLEFLVETLVKQHIDENKNIIKANHDLLNEINEVRQIISRHDVSYLI